MEKIKVLIIDIISTLRLFTNKLLIVCIVPALIGCDTASVIYPTRKDIVETVYASGKIVPQNEHWLSAQKTGIIIKKLVDDGDTVTRGQLLYVINDYVADKRFAAAVASYNAITYNLSPSSPVLQDLQLALHNAEVQLKNDSTNYVRWRNLWEHDIGTKSNLDKSYSQFLVSRNDKQIAEQKYYSLLRDLQTSRRISRSELSSARKNFDDIYIRSDANGIAYRTLKETGELVKDNETLVLLGDECDHIIRLSVDQEDIDKIRVGQQILLEVDAIESEVFEASVTFISQVMNELDQTFRVEARFNPPVNQGFIYTSVEANIIVDKRKKALVLPRTALIAGDSILVRENGREKKVAVQLGISTLDHVEVLSGVRENTAVLVDLQNTR
jgi:HlyD family secretion protein